MTGAGGEDRSRSPDFVVDIDRALVTVFIVSLAIVLLLVFLDYGVNYSQWSETGAIRRLFNITREDGLASWYGVTVTTLTALTAWFITAIVRRQGVTPSRAAGWTVIALFLTWMALDDGATIHERLGTAVDQESVAAEGEPAAEAEPGIVTRFPSYTWQLLFGPVFAGLGFFTLGFLWREMGSRRKRWMVALAVGLLGFAVVLDFFEGLAPEHPWNLYTAITARTDLSGFTLSHFGQPPYETLRHFSKSVEEAVEIVAMTLLGIALLGHLARLADGLRVRLKRTGTA